MAKGHCHSLSSSCCHDSVSDVGRQVKSMVDNEPGPQHFQLERTSYLSSIRFLLLGSAYL